MIWEQVRARQRRKASAVADCGEKILFICRVPMPPPLCRTVLADLHRKAAVSIIQ